MTKDLVDHILGLLGISEGVLSSVAKRVENQIATRQAGPVEEASKPLRSFGTRLTIGPELEFAEQSDATLSELLGPHLYELGEAEIEQRRMKRNTPDTRL
jgi:hypothetical protein